MRADARVATQLAVALRLCSKLKLKTILPAMKHLICLPIGLSLTLAARATISSVTVTSNGLVTGLKPGYTLVEALNFQGANLTRSGINFVGENMTDGSGGSATASTLSGGVLATADIGSAIDGFFYTEVWNNGGTGMQIVLSGLDPAKSYFFETYHGENRNLPGTFSSDTLIDANGTVAVPTYTFGNTIANENPPAAADRMTISANITGVSTFTYRMPNGAGRGASMNGYQLQVIPEPGSAALLGLTGVMVIRRRRR
jgi:hypothetical protein